jgi:hypothetical protein
VSRVQIGARVFAVVAALSVIACGQQKSVDAPARTASGPVALDAKVCKPVTDAQRKWLSADFQTWSRFAIACPVQPSGGPVALFVVSVDGSEIEDSLPSNAPAPTLPKALLVLPDGSVVGQLPYAYPFDAPVNLDLVFADWADGLPHTIEMMLEDPTVTGNKTLPSLKWNHTLRTYGG